MIFGAPPYKFRRLTNVAVPDEILVMELVATTKDTKYDGVIVAVHIQGDEGNFRVGFELMSIPVSLSKHTEKVKLGRGRVFKDIKTITEKLCNLYLKSAIKDLEDERNQQRSLHGRDDNLRGDGELGTDGTEDSPAPQA